MQRTYPDGFRPFLSDKTWRRVCALLNDALSADRSHGVSFVAPSYPEVGQEAYVICELETSEMNWIVGQPERPMSRAILDDNRDYDEVLRMRKSLNNTVAVLDAWLRDNEPEKEPPSP